MVTDLLTLDEETLSPPETRIKDVQGVRSRIDELKEGDQNRAWSRAKVQGIVDGNAPYNQEKMSAAGRADDANINLRGAEGRLAAATTPYYELDFGVPRAADIVLYFGTNKQKNFEWSEALSGRFSETLWAWKGYKINRQLSHYQMCLHGRGPIMWDNDKGWHYHAKRDDAVLVNDNAMCDVELLSEAAMPGHWTPTQLFEMIDKEVSEKSGWKIDIAKRAIINAAPKSFKDTYHDAWPAYQASLRRGDVIWENREARVYYTDYLIKEFSGKVTHAIVLDSRPDNQKDGADDFVYKKIGRFASFHQILVPFHFDVGPDGHWYSVKGLGPKIYDDCDVENRMWCTAINGAMASCGIVMKAQNGQALQKLQQTPLTRFSGITAVPPDWDFAQQNIAPKLDGALAIIQGLSRLTDINTGQYRQRAGEENQEPTYGQAQLNVAQQSGLNRGAYDRYYHYRDDELEELLRRMLDPNLSEKHPGGKEALEMKRKLIEEDQVPEEALKFDKVCSVRAVRNIGYGSPQNQQVVNQQLLQLIGTMDEEGRNHTLRMVGTSLPGIGSSQVDRFWKKFEDLGIPNDQEAMAVLENNVLRQPNGKLIVTGAQNPTIHFTEHFKDSLSHVQEVKGGQGDLQMLVVHLDNAGPHIHLHLEALKGDPTKKNEYKQFVKMQMMLGKIADQIKKQVAKTRKGQKPQSNIDPKMIEGLLKLQGELKLKEMKLTADEARKDKKLEGDMKRKDQSTAANIYRRNVETMRV